MRPVSDTRSSFWRSPPGQRFANRYWRHSETREKRSRILRFAMLGLGGVLAVLGVLLLVLPGPGILLLITAGAIFASESLTVARVLDWLELDARAAWHWIRRRVRRKKR